MKFLLPRITEKLPRSVDAVLAAVVVMSIIFINIADLTWINASRFYSGLALVLGIVVILGGGAYWIWRSFRAIVYVMQEARSIGSMRLFALLVTNAFVWMIGLFIFQSLGYTETSDSAATGRILGEIAFIVVAVILFRRISGGKI